MADRAASFLDRVRNPEYTGENRCVPCTVVNVIVAVAASALAATVAVELGVVAFLCSATAIYLRGYLVPGTPTLTRRYAPDWFLSLFDKDPRETMETGEPAETGETTGDPGRNAVDPERFLLEANVVEPCDDEDDLCLTDGFADRVRRRTERHREGPVDGASLAALFDADPAAVTVEDGEHPSVSVERRTHGWPSNGALVADVATHEALAERTDRWTDVPLEQRLLVLRSLRSFHETCPLCDGDIALESDAVESCCRSYEVVTVGCLECGEPLLELDPTALEAGSADGAARP